MDETTNLNPPVVVKELARIPRRFMGEDEIFFANLNARSFYFCDTAGNILEFIVHYGLNHETERT